MKYIIELIEGIQKDVISKLEKQEIKPNKIKVKNMINDYISKYLTELSIDDIIINGLCEEYKNNKDIY